MNPGYSDVRYMVYIWGNMVYIWGFPYLDYYFDVLISQNRNLGLCNWCCHIYFTWCLIAYSYVPVIMTQFFNTWFWLGHIGARVFFMHGTWHSSYHSLGYFWQLWTCMPRFRSLELVDSPDCWLECAVEAWIIADLPGPYPSRPLLVSRVFFL